MIKMLASLISYNTERRQKRGIRFHNTSSDFASEVSFSIYQIQRRIIKYFIRRYFDADPPYKSSDTVENASEHKTEKHKNLATDPGCEAIVDRFTSLEEVSEVIRAEGVDKCGLIFGM